MINKSSVKIVFKRYPSSTHTSNLVLDITVQFQDFDLLRKSNNRKFSVCCSRGCREMHKQLPVCVTDQLELYWCRREQPAVLSTAWMWVKTYCNKHKGWNVQNCETRYCETSSFSVNLNYTIKTLAWAFASIPGYCFTIYYFILLILRTICSWA